MSDSGIPSSVREQALRDAAAGGEGTVVDVAVSPADAPGSNSTSAPPGQQQPAKARQGPRLYDRRFSVQVYDANGKGLELAGLRCHFVVRQNELATPNHVSLKITNLSAATASRMMKEFTRVQIGAGYEGQYGVIFDGTIIQARRGRDSPTDTFCAIVATDGDQAHNTATVSATLPAGSKPEDVHRVVLSAFNQHGVHKGYTDPAMTGPGLPRGRVLYGMARERMREVARSTNTQWSIQNGRMQVTSPSGYLATEVVVITKETGMVGLPVIAPDGVHVRCLLNPLLKVGQRIKLDNNSVQSPAQSAGPQGQRDQALLPKIDGDGLYKVLAVDHFGDTRGNEWYSEIEAVGVTEAGTVASAARGRGTWTDPASPSSQQPSPAPAKPAAPAIPTPPRPPVAPLRPNSVTEKAGI